MTTIIKKTIKGKQYYYLAHTFTKGKKTDKRELYLGKEIPANVEKIKQIFFYNLFKERFFGVLGQIKKNFAREFMEMPPTAKEDYLNYFMIKFTYDSNRIEGSTLTLKETADILEKGLSPANKPITDIKESEAHKKTFYAMVNHKKDLSLPTVLSWHRTLLQDTRADIAGKIRNHQVKVARSRTEFPLPSELDFLLREFLTWYNQSKNKLHPVEVAALAHFKFMSIHPFSDGNGRISRLMMNFVLHKYGFPMLNIKYIHRSNYYTALERAQLTGKEYIFVQHILRRYIKEYKKYLKP